MTPIKIVLFSAVLTLTLAFTLHRMSLMRPSRAAEDNPLNYSYWPALPKTDREPLRITPPPPVPIPEPLVHEVLVSRPNAVTKKPPPSDDGICARYNLHKVWTPNGKSWHCRPH
jgi:hypothetical protein